MFCSPIVAANDGQLQFSLSESSLIGSRDEDENMEQDGTSNYGLLMLGLCSVL